MTSEESHGYCVSYMKEIFDKWDKDGSGVLERQELKDMLRAELKAAPKKHNHIRKNFYELTKAEDSNKNGKVDRWEIYQKCIKNYNPYALE